MTKAAYDEFDYPSYWRGRSYEHESEVIALKRLLSLVSKVRRAVDIGSGYGRLYPYYSYRAQKIVLVDPSRKLLTIARKNIQDSKTRFIHSTAEKIKLKIRKGYADLVILTRVLHHFTNVQKVLELCAHISRKGAYIIIEFPNKKHIKATFKQLFRGNILFPIDIFPLDMRSEYSRKTRSIPFTNYHPDYIEQCLTLNGYKIVKRLSVSNIRSSFFKKHVPIHLLLFIEKHIQSLFAQINFGPSIFILARKIR